MIITKEEIKPLGITAIILFTAAIAGGLFTPTSFTSMISLAFAIFTYIILPGYFILLNFNLTALERIIFGMPTSITIVSIALYSVDIIGIPLSRTTTLTIILIVSVAGLVLRKYTQTTPSS